MTLDIKEIMDYCYCPKLYKLRSDKDKPTLLEKYNQALYNVYFTYLRAFQNNTLVRTFEYLKDEWAKEWITDNDLHSITIKPVNVNRDIYSVRRVTGFDAICNFDKLLKGDQFPIVIDEPYEVNIEGVTVTGTWHYIRELHNGINKRIQLIKILPDNNRFINASVIAKKDIEITAMAYAFKQTFKNDFDIVIIDPHRNSIKRTTRTEEDYNILKDTVVSCALSNKHNLNCYSPDVKCWSCDYRNHCL